MFFFNRNKRISDIGLLHGATDWHCHILPGVDDGIQMMSDALSVLARYEQLGIKEVWLTPHTMEDIPNTPEQLRERYEMLQNEYNGPIKLNLASEHLMDGLFATRLAAGNVMPIGHKGNHLLVETGFNQQLMNLNTIIEQIKEAGYTPLLAHPERYLYMSDHDYDMLKTHRVKFQLNVLSLAGIYGRAVQERAAQLLEKGYYNVWGSDLHNLPVFDDYITRKALRRDLVESLLRVPNVIL